MGLLTPFALLFAALGIPIILLYMLKLRRRDVLVSSTFLWRRLLRDRQANAPWQRLRRNLLLLLQLLVLALLTLALARPFILAPVAVRGSAVILLDSSASMQARDVLPSRFDAGVQVAQEIVTGLGPGDVMTVIAVGPQPQVLAQAEGDRALLRRALESAQPADGPADWEAAFALATAGFAGAEDPQVVIISDGAVPEALPPLPGEVHFVGVGGSGDNLAITALATRQGPTGPRAFLRVANYGDADAEPLVEISAGGDLVDARRLFVPARASADLTLADLVYDLQVLQARLAVEDMLPLDDMAWAVHVPPASGRVLLVSDGNLFLERALGALPGVDVVRLAPGSPVPASPGGTEAGYDLYVADGTAIGTLPQGNLWLIGPQPTVPTSEEQGEGGTSALQIGNLFTATTITRVAAADPLLRYVDLSDVHVRQARAVVPPPGARVLVEAAGGALLFVAQRPEGRLAVLTFDLRDSDLPLQIAFPVLTANLVDWLLPRTGVPLAAAVGPGEPVSIQPHPEATQVVVTAPGGTRHLIQPAEEVLTFAATDRLGIYQVEQLDGSGRVLQSAVWAVNLFDEAESNIRPQEVVRVGQAELSSAAGEEEGRRELWPWLVGATLGVLVVEWWTYQRETVRWDTRG